nr:annexin A3 isoform X2 [Chrysemys picta bellii]
MASVWVGSRGTIRDYTGFNASKDAETVRKAIRGIGTDEKTLINTLTERSNAQRQLIAKEYRAASGKDLKDDLKSDLSGNLERIMVALVTPPAVFDAKQLKKSMKGSGTNEKALIEILASRSSKQMKEVSQAYYTVYKTSLGDDLSSDTSGDFRKALLTLADGRRDENVKVDEHLAKKDAQVLYNAGEKKWGTDEDKFTEILCLRSIPQLKRREEMESLILNPGSRMMALLLSSYGMCSSKGCSNIEGSGKTPINFTKVWIRPQMEPDT